jgi:hypothetical protein
MSRIHSKLAAAPRIVRCLCLVWLAGSAGLTPAAIKDPLKVPKKSVLVTTTIDLGDGLSATLTEFFSGEKSEKAGIDILVGVHRGGAENRVLVASRDYNEQAGGFVSRGSLEVIDLDHDGTKDILVNYHHHERVGETRIELDVLKLVGDSLVLAWTGPLRVDTTSQTLGLPPPDRERFSREIGYMRTAAAQGSKIYFTKTVSVAAGVVFDPPRVIEEELDFSAPADSGHR